MSQHSLQIQIEAIAIFNIIFGYREYLIHYPSDMTSVPLPSPHIKLNFEMRMVSKS